MAEFPRYILMGTRPVKAVPTAEGGVDVLAWDFEKGEFVRDIRLLAYVWNLGGIADGGVIELTEAQFNEAVEDVRQARLRGKLIGV